jgi:hypothetical protein
MFEAFPTFKAFGRPEVLDIESPPKWGGPSVELDQFIVAPPHTMLQ